MRSAVRLFLLCCGFGFVATSAACHMHVSCCREYLQAGGETLEEAVPCQWTHLPGEAIQPSKFCCHLMARRQVVFRGPGPLFVNCVCTIKSTPYFRLYGIYHVLLFFHVRPASEPSTTGVALCSKTFGDPCLRLR